MNIYPISFWLNCLVICFFIIPLTLRWAQVMNIARLGVIITLSFWYIGDIIYAEDHSITGVYTQEIINLSLNQLLMTILFFIFFSSFFKQKLQKKIRKSQPRLNEYTIESKEKELQAIFKFILYSWLILFLIAQFNIGFKLMGSIFPPLSNDYVNLWRRGRFGGSLGFLISTGGYIHKFLSSMFGLFFIISKDKKIKKMSLMMLVISWPYFFFGVGRNIMLAVSMPAIIAYILFYKHSKTQKTLVLFSLLMFFHVWFSFVLKNRKQGLAATFKNEGIEIPADDAKHHGLDMFKELCYINEFHQQGLIELKWGQGYLAQALNIVPRAIWPNKPAIGIDYSLLRGATRTGEYEVSHTVSLGVIGQGIIEFGPFIGCIFLAFLLAIWSYIISHFWHRRYNILYLTLFLVGLSLTFNCGREITLLVLFPFIFGFIFLKIYEKTTLSSNKALIW